jgi:hypothetical protein
MRVRRWSNFIKFFGFALVVRGSKYIFYLISIATLLCALQVLGFAELVYGVVGGLAWADFVVGGVTVCVGLLGLYAGFRPSIGAAKRVRASLFPFFPGGARSHTHTHTHTRL